MVAITSEAGGPLVVADPCAHVRAAGRPGRCCRGVGLWVAYGQQGGRTLGGSTARSGQGSGSRWARPKLSGSSEMSGDSVGSEEESSIAGGQSHPRQEDPWWWLIPARMCERLVGAMLPRRWAVGGIRATRRSDAGGKHCSADKDRWSGGGCGGGRDVVLASGTVAYQAVVHVCCRCRRPPVVRHSRW